MSNLNDYVWVRLTEDGKEVLRAHFLKFVQPNDLVGTLAHYEVGESWSRFQLHELMHIFGEKTFNGCPQQMFEENMIHHTYPLAF